MLTVLAVAALAMGCETAERNDQSMQVPPPSYEAGEPEPVPADEGAAMAESDAAPAEAESDAAPAEADGQSAAAPEPMNDDAGGASTYTIQKGDTLWSIAQDAYGDGQKWVDIARANPGLEPEKMSVGQQITLP